MGIIRIVYSHRVFFESYDVTWEGPILLIWTHMELHLGIICACAPALKAFFVHHNIVSFGSLVPSSISRRSHSSRNAIMGPKSQESSEGTKASSEGTKVSLDGTKTSMDATKASYRLTLQGLDGHGSVDAPEAIHHGV
jgi:hypothetical protein